MLRYVRGSPRKWIQSFFVWGRRTVGAFEGELNECLCFYMFQQCVWAEMILWSINVSINVEAPCYVKGQVEKIYHDKLSWYILLSVGNKKSSPTHQIHRQKLKYALTKDSSKVQQMALQDKSPIKLILKQMIFSSKRKSLVVLASLWSCLNF